MKISSPLMLYITILSIIFGVVGVGMGFAALTAKPASTAPAPAPSDYHRVELRIEGDGRGQIARVWDLEGTRDVDPGGLALPVTALRGVLYTVLAGPQPASCVVLLDGAETARVRAEPGAVATCAWVAER